MDELHLGEICDRCGSAVVPILWGMPTEAGFAEAQANGWYIGGCCVDERRSRCECGATSYDDEGRRVRVPADEWSE